MNKGAINDISQPISRGNDEKVGNLTLNRPDKQNALSIPFGV